MITCRKCNKTGSNQLFSTRRGKKTNLCLVCKRTYDNEFYRTKVDRSRRYKQVNARKQELRKAVWDFLSKNPCVDCGEKDPVVLEFDHIDANNKSMEISLMKQRGNSILRIVSEIKKCEVRCANCHRRRTRKQFNYQQGLAQQ